jgi:hypothetical protein
MPGKHYYIANSDLQLLYLNKKIIEEMRVQDLSLYEAL